MGLDSTSGTLFLISLASFLFVLTAFLVRIGGRPAGVAMERLLGETLSADVVPASSLRIVVVNCAVQCVAFMGIW